MRLATPRLILRDFVPADWPALHMVESRSDVARFQSFAPRSEAESRAYVLQAIAASKEQPRRVYDLAMELRSERQVIGRCGFEVTDPDNATAMLWYNLHPRHWGQGLTTEAARALVDYGFRELALHRIWADCDPRNAASWRVLAKIGMRREGHLRENILTDEGWADSYIYAVLDHEWPATMAAATAADEPPDEQPDAVPETGRETDGPDRAD